MKFFRQYSIGPYILDFYCPTVKLAVELNGGQHKQSDNREHDAAPSDYLTLNPSTPPLSVRGGWVGLSCTVRGSYKGGIEGATRGGCKEA